MIFFNRNKRPPTQPVWTPQLHDDFDAWVKIITCPDAHERTLGYRTQSDMLLGEIIRNAIQSTDAMIHDLMRLYDLSLNQGCPQDIRYQIYKEAAAAQQKEPTVVSYNAYLPFIFCETAQGIVGSATIDFVSLGDLIDGDPMTRVKEVIGFIKRALIPNRAAAFGALLFIGDHRVSRLLLPYRDELKSEEVSIVVNSCTGCICAAAVEFLLDWLEGLDGDADDGLFGTVAAGLMNVRRMSNSPMVMTGIRPYPVTSVSPHKQAQMGRVISLDDYTARIAPRLRALERTESESKIMPVVLEAWGIQ